MNEHQHASPYPRFAAMIVVSTVSCTGSCS